MRGKGVVLGIVLVLVILQIPIHVEAGRAEKTLSWQCGLRISLLAENNDFWTTDSVSEIFFTLTLLDAGTVVDFQALIFQVTLVTERNYTGEIIIVNPWNATGDVARLTGQFAVSREDVNNAGWDIYVASIYYNFSVLVELSGGEDMRLYTYVYEGTPLSISTFSFIVLWPFPPIILMGAAYWILYIGVRRFNKRYAGLESTDADEEKQEEKSVP
jgi:hypothetical protein